MTPSLLLVEDHTIMAGMLSRLLQERGKMIVAAITHTAEAALETLAVLAVEGTPPSLALIDVSLPGMSGIDLLGELAPLYPDMPCIMLSAHYDLRYVRRALEKGARGYVAKGDSPAIIEAIGQVLAGDIYLSAAIRQALEV